MSDIIFILTWLVCSSLLTFFLMPFWIKVFERYELWKKIRTEWLVGKATEFARLHKAKAGTPTMGGVFILLSVIILTILSMIMQSLSPFIHDFLWFKINYSLWNQNETYLVIGTLLSVGVIWIIDDYLNIREIGRTKWLSARVKMICLVIFALIWAYWFSSKLDHSSLFVPFIGDIDLSSHTLDIIFWWLNLHILYMIIFVIIVISAANSVNITDWLDGLAGWLLFFQYAAYGFITYTQWLFILSTLCFIIAWALLAFLWFNIHPAQIFMGDVGSLSLGATLAIVAFITNTIPAFIVMSGIFIFETLSVIIQMTSKKLRKWKKIFRVAPFHHHLEAIGWQEQTIVMRLWLIGIILTIIGMILAMIGR